MGVSHVSHQKWRAESRIGHPGTPNSIKNVKRSERHEIRHVAPDGPRTGGDGEEDAEAGLDAAGIDAGRPAAEGAAALGDVRVSAGFIRGCDAARAETGGVVYGAGRVKARSRDRQALPDRACGRDSKSF